MDIPFKNKNNFKKQITCFGYSKNEKEKNMTKNAKNVMEQNESMEEKNFMNSLKSNEALKSVLFKAKNITKNLASVVVPQMATAIKSLMTEASSGKIEIKDWNTIKFLRSHCYDLASYDRQKDLNQNFEVSITMAVRLAIMMFSKPEQFDVTKNNEILVTIDGNTFNQQDFDYIQQLSEILNDSGEPAFHGKLGNITVEIFETMNTFEKELICVS